MMRLVFQSKSIGCMRSKFQASLTTLYVRSLLCFHTKGPHHIWSGDGGEGIFLGIMFFQIFPVLGRKGTDGPDALISLINKVTKARVKTMGQFIDKNIGCPMPTAEAPQSLFVNIL